MTILVTGSAGHLGEALMRTLPRVGHKALGLDITASAFTQEVGTITDRGFVRRCMRDVHAVLHTATLHKPHVATHTRQDFVDTNITGTLNLLEEAVSAGVSAFIFTSTTSAFGRALTPPEGAPAAWITEEVTPVPRNIYGVTKVAAESLCELFHRHFGLPCLVLRTSRFFPEPDDREETRRVGAAVQLDRVGRVLGECAGLVEHIGDETIGVVERARAAFAGRSAEVGFQRLHAVVFGHHQER